MRARRRGLALLVLAGAVVGCREPASTPRGTAERFLDAHYVRIDLPAARTYTSGLAQQKIDDETRLTRGQTIDEGTRMPRVHYRLVDERSPADGVVSLVYEATFHVEGAEALQRKLQLTVRRDGDGWSVTNYQEY
jgi:hypothetical protein